MGVAINLVFFPLSYLSGVGIRSRRFHAAVGPGTHVSFICVAQYSQDHKALTCKSYNRVKSRVSNERTEAEIKFPAFESWLSARLRYLQCVCYWDADLSSIYMTCWIWQNLVHVMACCLRATGHRAISENLQTTLELPLRIPLASFTNMV